MLNRYRLPFALIVYTICFAALYHLYRYKFDDDGIGYLMVAKRLAAGDFFNGINGYWSPLHSWLIAPFLKTGINEFTAFKLSNGLIGVGILIIVNRLSSKTNLQPALRTITLLVCIPIVLAYAFHDLAADILLCLLLLIYTDIISAKDFFTNRRKIFACAVVGCLCYFAKTYAFYFFLVHFSIVQIVLCRNSSLPDRKKFLTKNLVSGIGLFLLLVSPWIIALYYKYNMLTAGYSGGLNHTWAMFPALPNTDKLLGAPPAPLFCFWEDPYYTTKYVQPHPSLLSGAVIMKQVRLTGHNLLVTLKCFYNISILSFAIIPALALYRRKTKDIILTNMLLVITILPLGYLLVHMETRFLWASTFLILIAGAVLLSSALQHAQAGISARIIFWIIFFASFLVYPYNSLKATAGKDAAVFRLAEELKQKDIKGKYLSDNNSYSEVERLAYFTGSIYYSLSRLNYTYDELLAACRENGVNYYFFYYDSPEDLFDFKQTSFYKQAVGEIITQRSGLLLLKMQ